MRAPPSPGAWTRDERRAFWTRVADGRGEFAGASLRDRLKASELLGRSEGDFIEHRSVENRLTLEELVAGSWHSSGGVSGAANHQGAPGPRPIPVGPETEHR